MKKYINPILSLGTAAALLGAIYFQNQQIDGLKKQLKLQPVVGGDIQKAQTIDSIEIQRDSLMDLLFEERVDAGRHEVTREEVLKKYPKIAKEYDEFYSHQTE
jgi:hypothetical protein